MLSEPDFEKASGFLARAVMTGPGVSGMAIQRLLEGEVREKVARDMRRLSININVCRFFLTRHAVFMD